MNLSVNNFRVPWNSSTTYIYVLHFRDYCLCFTTTNIIVADDDEEKSHEIGIPGNIGIYILELELDL